jgi:hypothetical protein
MCGGRVGEKGEWRGKRGKNSETACNGEKNSVIT